MKKKNSELQIYPRNLLFVVIGVRWWKTGIGGQAIKLHSLLLLDHFQAAHLHLQSESHCSLRDGGGEGGGGGGAGGSDFGGGSAGARNGEGRRGGEGGHRAGAGGEARRLQAPR